VFKNDIMNYKDQNRMFMDQTLSQIDYFNDLEEQTKQEWIYSMTLKIFEQN